MFALTFVTVMFNTLSSTYSKQAYKNFKVFNKLDLSMSEMASSNNY